MSTFHPPNFTSPMSAASIAVELARCDREIAAMENQEPRQPAYLTTLGIEDWRAEKRLLEAMLPAVCPFCCPEVIARKLARAGKTCQPCAYNESGFTPAPQSDESYEASAAVLEMRAKAPADKGAL